MSTALIVREAGKPIRVNFPAVILEQRDAALNATALISRVTNAQENEVASAGAKVAHEFIAAMEKLRVLEKMPWLELGRLLDQAFAELVAEAKAEHLRVNKLQGDFLTLEDAKRRDAEAARMRDLAELERQKREAMAQAQSHEQREAVQAQYEGLKASVPEPPPVPRAKGQSARPKWEIEIEDIHALYRAHPHAVKLEPKLIEIYALLDRLPEGQMLPGVRAERVLKPQQTGTRQPRVLELQEGAA